MKASTLDFEVLKQPSTKSVTNLIGNSDFETDLSGWSALNSTTLTRITSDSLHGSACLQVTAPLGGVNGVAALYTYAPGGVLPFRKYRVSVWVKGITGGGRGSAFNVVESGGAAGNATNQLGSVSFPNSSWNLYSRVFQIQQSDRTSLLFEPALINASAGDIVLFDALEVVDDAVLNSLIGGSPFPVDFLQANANTPVSRLIPLGHPSPVLLPAASKQIVVATISATSSLAGNIGARRPVPPGNINATSSLSGRVTALKHITAGNINATSSVSGSLVAKRVIVPTGINATSTVAAGITLLHSISANINAVSTINSAVGALRKVSPANLIGTSTISANIKRLVFVVGANINAVSTLSGNLNTARGILSASINALSTITGQVRLTKPIITTNISVITVLSAGVVVLRPITSGNINATSTILGDISKIIFHGPLITFDIEVGNRNWFASVTKQAWDASPTLPIRDWNVSV